MLLVKKDMPAGTHTGKKTAKIAYWNYNYAPKWEAASKEIEMLYNEFDKRFDVRLIAQNLSSKNISLFGKHKMLPLPFSLIGLPFFRRLASQYKINHIFSSFAEPLLIPRISHLNALLTITKNTESLTRLEKNIVHLKKMKFIVVESERHREILVQAGINEKSIKLIYPGFKIKPAHNPEYPFKILFATSPQGKFELLTRGIYLMLHAAALLPDVRFVLVWREQYLKELQALISNYKLNNIEVVNGYIPDMERVYERIHTTILPGLDYNSLKPCPHSAMNTLAHGKPLLVSSPTSISGLVSRKKCGVVFEPTIESLVSSVNFLKDNYGEFQKNCHQAIKESFSAETFIDKYRKLYELMLGY